MYLSAEPSLAPLVALQYCDAPSGSPENSEPPTPVTYGRAAGISTAKPPWAGSPGEVSQSAGPKSPAAATTVCPCAFACCPREMNSWTSLDARFASQVPKLLLMIGALLLSMAS